jgi:hypothetical protein
MRQVRFICSDLAAQPAGSSCLRGEPDTNECVIEDPDGFEGISPEKTDEMEVVGREGVVEVGGHFFIGEPAYYPAVHLETPEHRTSLGELASIKVWQGVGCELAEALQ